MTQIKDIAITKTIAGNSDYLILQNPATGETYKISKNDFLAGVTSGGSIQIPPSYPAGMALWIEGGSLIDKSPNSRNASPIGTAPAKTVGLDGKNVLTWNGSGTQELQVSPFLAGTTGSTFYVIFSVRADSSYNLIETANFANIGDHWRYIGDGDGYFGLARSARINRYPTNMPANGNHLVSIHSSVSVYEVMLDNISKGVLSPDYNPGDRFRIGINELPFSGDIALILVYPVYIDKLSDTHANCIAAIRNNYPSLILA